MAMTMHLDVVSAEESIFSGVVQELLAPGTMGDLGILPGHSQLISTLKAGELKYKTDDGESLLFVAGGVMEVQPSIVTILADTIVRAEDLDEKAAEEAKKRAEDALQGKDPQDLDYEAIQAELDAAKAQIEMIHRIGRTLR
ncbi:F0F1 ATP synthase subunit epsilon [Cocleimonas flava]|jgi:F-type H+-transporting ATPase subunit epsilon|uniref:ATP synthase epsilon chain n=1 Tax=Cocleimonas flava TaxID=634765 RepID=A0A4R1ET00_9GAMM|nr:MULTISPECIES: F0F1 ATP synthase subunit epsilon [Cocleimonas]MEB8432404.1 F0F1 ATP synthase subunit epsilon [Cocleimonas sp. KMM 6892]MEC4715263.1 F0F1 ATP synthase subunit epsilon [Cocleimonas sp. KMM 6895]MEC4745118.1 F0F1 ATP synthase subunit epsilon [Cocleimonas sp. KMM 6896]TCJ82839.1 ATP synthase F1 subcomplex epsilon subunit [Cocleimonas flava]